MALPPAPGPCRLSAEGPAAPLTARCFRSGSSSSREPPPGSAVGELFRFRITREGNGRERRGGQRGAGPQLDGWWEERAAQDSAAAPQCFHCGRFGDPQGAADLPQPITAQKRHHVLKCAASTAAEERRNNDIQNKSSARCLQGNVVSATVSSVLNSKGNKKLRFLKKTNRKVENYASLFW